MLLADKRLVITGVLSEASIAFAVAKTAQEQGAEIVLTSFGRSRRLTERTAQRLPVVPDVIELDASKDEDFRNLTTELDRRWGRVDGALHAIGFAPETCLGGDFLRAGWDDVAVALRISAYSFKSLAESLVPLMRQGGGSLVALDFDARVAWPQYNWMGVAKAALESTGRYLARDLGVHGIRVNLVCAGPLHTLASRGVPGLSEIELLWKQRAPLGWDAADADGVARTCAALLSDWLPTTTGEMLHADGGVHMIGDGMVS
jgi:meromycolic acid enoyl-[acyl-carrier-protein] reductase